MFKTKVLHSKKEKESSVQLTVHWNLSSFQLWYKYIQKLCTRMIMTTFLTMILSVFHKLLDASRFVCFFHFFFFLSYCSSEFALVGLSLSLFCALSLSLSCKGQITLKALAVSSRSEMLESRTHHSPRSVYEWVWSQPQQIPVQLFSINKSNLWTEQLPAYHSTTRCLGDPHEQIFL